MQITHYFRLIVSTSEIARLEFNNYFTLSRNAALDLVNEWNSNSARHCKGNFLYWIEN